MIDPRNPRMMPGQEPYSQRDLDRLYRLIDDAAAGDPGEAGEAEARAAFDPREIAAIVAAGDDIERCDDCGHAVDSHDRRAEDGSCEHCDDVASVGGYSPCATIGRAIDPHADHDLETCGECRIRAGIPEDFD